MAVYFGVPLLQLKTGTLSVADCSLLKADERVNEAIFAGWRPDLSIETANPNGPTLMKKESERIALVLRAKYYEDFERELIVVPEQQFIDCLKLQKRIKSDDGTMCDVAIVMATFGDVFCVTGPEHDEFFIVCEDQVLVRKIPTYRSLSSVSASYSHTIGRQMFNLKRVNFSFKMWREVLPEFRS